MWNYLRRVVSAWGPGKSPLALLLPEAWVQQALQAAGYTDGSSVYTPVVTVLAWVKQMISNRPSCQKAVQALIAQRAADGQNAVSADTSGYCKARQRVPESVCWDLMRRSGHDLERQAPASWTWCGRRVKTVDGSTLRIADTEKNRAEYPLQRGLKPGLSYPVVRILAVFSFAVGTVLEAALRPYQGKGTGETGMLRELADRFEPGDVLLGDRYFCGYWDIAFWLQRGVDTVARNSACRKSDFRSGVRLGKDDHLIEWKRTARPDWVTPEMARAFPDTLTLRETRVRIVQRGFRTRAVIVITTLLDPVAFPAEALAELYRCRWDAELNLRSLKTEMGLEQLRCKSPEMVRKELALALTAYNVVRRATTAAAETGPPGIRPWHVSFQGARDGINEFLPRLPTAGDREHWLQHWLGSTAQLQVRHRPDRIEPYTTKTRPKEYPPPRETRQEYRTRMKKR